MKSASQMSLEIRRKKKAMQDNTDVMTESGIPMDKQDEDLEEQHELTTDLGMDTNRPKMRDEEPSAHQVLMQDSHDRAHETEEPMSNRVHMMAKGGDPMETAATTVRPDKGFGKVIMISKEPDDDQPRMAEGGEVRGSGSRTEDRNSGGPLEQTAKQKRLARLAGRMNK